MNDKFASSIAAFITAWVIMIFGAVQHNDIVFAMGIFAFFLFNLSNAR